MKHLNFKPFDRNELVANLKKAFPNHKIQDTMGNLQVRTSGFTMTGNVQLKTSPTTGKITTKTNLDFLPMFILIPPIGLYILSKKKKIIALEQEVAKKLNTLLTPV